MDSGLSRFDYE